jgi:hypothetical protein
MSALLAGRVGCSAARRFNPLISEEEWILQGAEDDVTRIASRLNPDFF